MITTDPDPFSVCSVLLATVQGNNVNGTVIIAILFIIVLLMMSALISGSEVAYFSLNPQQLQDLSKNEDKRSQLILQHLEKRSNLLGSILVTNNFVNVAIILIFTFVSESIFNLAGRPVLQFLYEVVIITSVLLLFGEILPKIIAARYPVRFAGIMARPLKFFHAIFYPIIYLLVTSTQIINKRIKRRGFDISRDELTDAVNITTSDTQPEGEKKMLQGIARFGDTEVSEIMKSRVDVVAIDAATDFLSLLDVVKKSNFSRIPVFTDTFDKVEGILYIKDLLPYYSHSESFVWNTLLRDAFFIPENKKINDLLREFQERKIHMAVVVDEYGGTSGIVTMEDVLEEIVGEIIDESDNTDDEIDYKKIDDKNYIFEGKVSLNDICKIIDADDRIFDEVKGEADSLAGLILEIKEEIPARDDTITWDKYTFIIKEVDNRRIKKVHFQIADYAR